MPNWNEIREEWESTKITFKALAEKHDVKEGTLKSRRSREKSTRNKDATKKKKDATIKKVATIKEPVILSDDLTDKQRLFCIYYIKYFNATKAYQKAYDCAYTTARVEGHRHLANPNISKEIDRMRNETLSEKKLSADDVLQMYIDIARADIGDYVEMDRSGYSVMVKSLENVDTSLISELSNTENGVKLKLADKMKAMEVLAKYTDFIPDHFKRQLEEERLKIAHAKAFGADDPEQYEDDGFNEALDETTSEVWNDDATDEDG